MVQATIVHSGVYDSLGSVGDYITLNFDGTPQVEVTSTAISSGSNVQFIINSGSRGKGSRPPLLHVEYIGNVLFSDSEVSVDDTINNTVSIVNNSGWGIVGTATPAKKYYYAFSYNPSGDNLTYMYGWLSFTKTSSTTELTFHEWAYNNVAGESITVGQTSAVPEPATYAGLLGLTALGFVYFRRQRQNRGQAA
tara:strand:- start:70 stop:651 length:582 start_codon:yes stop_codon:yes gene_type:complete